MLQITGGSATSPAVTPLVAALGDVNRHDYGAGAAVLEHLAGRGLDVTLVRCDVDTTTSADFWRDRDLAILVEPVTARPCHPGRVHQIVVPRPGGGRLILFALEVGETADGEGLSPAVAAGARRVANAIAAEIGAAEIGMGTGAGRAAVSTRWRFLRSHA
jgi:hypothetical protein